jgi:cytochrome c oxidase assembly protein subunit 19
MAPDNFENLGLIFKDGEGKSQSPASTNAKAAGSQ